MVKAALQTMSITKGSPYAYNKWLAKQVSMLGDKAKECVDYGEECLKSATLEDIINNAKLLRTLLKDELKKRFGEKQWIEEWWKFNTNPPEVNLAYAKKFESKKNNEENERERYM